MRIFIALTFPEDFLNKIEKDIKDIKKKIKGKWIEKEKWHLTLAFLGERSIQEVDLIQKFLLSLKFNQVQLSTFKIDYSLPIKNKVRMIWVHFKYDNFNNFQIIFDKFNVDRFYPHINLIRFEPRVLSKLPYIRKDLNLNVCPKKLVLFESILKREGAQYKELLAIELL